jgi:hypothetical protein
MRTVAAGLERRVRARRNSIRARVEWRPDVTGEHIGYRSSQVDPHAGGPARRLPRSTFNVILLVAAPDLLLA